MSAINPSSGKSLGILKKELTKNAGHRLPSIGSCLIHHHVEKPFLSSLPAAIERTISGPSYYGIHDALYLKHIASLLKASMKKIGKRQSYTASFPRIKKKMARQSHFWSY